MFLSNTSATPPDESNWRTWANMPQFGPPPQSIGVVIDGSFGNDAGELLALAVLYGLDAKGECRVISLSTAKTNVKSAALLDVTAKFYASGTTIPVEFRRNIAIGMNDLGWSKEDTPLLHAVFSKPERITSVQKFNDTAEPHALIRNMLTAQPDSLGTIVVLGPATNAARTLTAQNGPIVVARKVRALTLNLAALKADVAAARKIFEQWPTPIIGVAPSDITYPAANLDTDFTWTQAHPLVDALRAASLKDIPAALAIPVLSAVRPKDEAWKLSPTGKLSIADNGAVSFKESPDGTHRMLTMDPSKKDAIQKAIQELASAKPAVRGRPNRQPQQKKEEPKKEEPKQP